MSYDLTPKNKKTDEIRIGEFSWPVMMAETGMGYVLGYGLSIFPGQYTYRDGNKGSPASNDGYRVNSFQAKAMAAVARGFVSVNRFLIKEYNGLSDLQKEAKFTLDDGTVKKMYKKPSGEKFLSELEKFADFAEQSGGFTIH